MAIPRLEYAPSSQNQRVTNYEVAGDERPRIFTTEYSLSSSEMDAIIQAAYRQIFNEQQLLKSNRQTLLESQLRSHQIDVREFIKGLLLSDSFRDRNYAPNNNYRFVQMCVQRVLGREVYDDREKISRSIVLATKGLNGFIDDLLNSDEYIENFGNNTVPYQRRRILPQRATGELPFARMPRYGADYRAKLEAMGYFQGRSFSTFTMGGTRWNWQKQPYPFVVRNIGAGVAVVGGALLALGVSATALAAWGIISL
jgi:phycobilisome rod-core linker protein